MNHGNNVFDDIRRLLPKFRVKTIIDVGANIGQSIDSFMLKCKGASMIHAFEPVQQTRTEIEHRYSNSVKIYPLALSSKPGKGYMIHRGTHDIFYLRHEHELHTQEIPIAESVDIQTLDQIFSEDVIDYLKIDTEGHDLEVLKGGGKMLAEGRARMIEVEAGMNRENKTHVPFQQFRDFLEHDEDGYTLGAYDYLLFGIYEQHHEWPTSQPNLRRCNPVFVHRSVIEENKTY